MYLHLGQETIVLQRNIVGIFDIETTSTQRQTREFLKHAEQELLVTNVCLELPKSFVVCTEETGERVYLSQISTQTLRKRVADL